MFILATLVNWRFPKQRMKLDASSICISNLLLLGANIHIYFQKRVAFRLLLFAATKVIYLYAKQLHRLLFLSMLFFLCALICLHILQTINFYMHFSYDNPLPVIFSIQKRIIILLFHAEQQQREGKY